MAEFLPGVDVGQVDFEGRRAPCGDGVAERDAGVGVGGGVQHDDVGGRSRLLDPSHQFALMIRLAEIDADAERTRGVADFQFDIRESESAVDAGFACTQQIQVRAIDTGRAWPEVIRGATGSQQEKGFGAGQLRTRARAHPSRAKAHQEVAGI